MSNKTRKGGYHLINRDDLSRLGGGIDFRLALGTWFVAPWDTGHCPKEARCTFWNRDMCKVTRYHAELGQLLQLHKGHVTESIVPTEEFSRFVLGFGLIRDGASEVMWLLGLGGFFWIES